MVAAYRIGLALGGLVACGPVAPTAPVVPLPPAGDALVGDAPHDGTTGSTSPAPAGAIGAATATLQLAGIELRSATTAASHTHGGKPAAISGTELEVRTLDDRPHRIAATALTLLRAHCLSTGWHSATALTVTALHASLLAPASGPDLAGSAAGIDLPAGAGIDYQLRIGFEATTVYQACDLFGFSVTLLVDGQATTLELPLEVTRYEPMER